MAVAYHHTSGRHSKGTPVQAFSQDADAQAMDAALREARNWAALRSASVFRCPVTATARLAVSCPVGKLTKTREPGRGLLQSLAGLWRSMR